MPTPSLSASRVSPPPNTKGTSQHLELKIVEWVLVKCHINEAGPQQDLSLQSHLKDWGSRELNPQSLDYKSSTLPLHQIRSYSLTKQKISNNLYICCTDHRLRSVGFCYFGSWVFVSVLPWLSIEIPKLINRVIAPFCQFCLWQKWNGSESQHGESCQ